MTTKQASSGGGPAAATSTRRRRAVESFGSAAAAIGPVESGLAVFVVTRGQFSMIDAIHHVLDQIGRASLSVWTWAIADYEVEAVGGLLARQDIDTARLVLDYSAGKRTPAIVDQWRELFGADQVRVCRNHAKICRCWNERYRVLLRGSCNLNYNPRFENLDLTEGGPDFDLVTRIEDELPVLPREHSQADAWAASQVARAFDASALGIFDEGKAWHP